MHEAKLVKRKIEEKKRALFGFFLQCAKLMMLWPFYIFPEKFCDINIFEELELDTDSLQVHLPIKNWPTVFDLKLEQNGRKSISVTVRTAFQRKQKIFFQLSFFSKYKKTWQKERNVYSVKNSDFGFAVSLRWVFFCYYGNASNNFKVSTEGVTDWMVEKKCDRPREMFCKVPGE